MPNAIDAVPVHANPVTSGTSEPVVAQPTGGGKVVPMRRGADVNSTYSTVPVTGRGVDPAAFARTTTPAKDTPAPAPTVVIVKEPEKKPGFFKRLGKALNPANWAKKVAEKSRGLARAIGWGSGAAAGAGTVATGALVANHVAPAAVHGVLAKIGLLGVLGPHGAALGGAIAAGVLTVGAIGTAAAFLRAGKKKKIEPKPEQPDQPKPEKADDGEKKPGFFRRAVSGVLNTVGITGGIGVAGYGLFQAGSAILGGATVAAALPMLALPAAALIGGGILVSAAKAIKGGD